MTELNGNPTDIKISQFGECYLYAPDLIGRVTELDPDDDSQTRAVGGYQAGALDAALDTSEFDLEYLFEFEVDDDGADATASDTRSGGGEMTTRDGEAAIMLTVQARRDGLGYAALHTDEGGWSQWIWPEGETDEAGFTQGDEVIFHLPRASAPRPAVPTETDEEGTRGPLGRFGQRLVRILTFATDPLVGNLILTYLPQREPQYKFLTLTEEGFKNRVDWANLHGQRTLLLIHGTFSRAEATFAALLPYAKPLLDAYEGRVIAFNHPSLRHDPQTNIDEFLNRLPEGIHLDLDLITHSRGGLVGRELCEHLADHNLGGRQITIRRAVFVAGPHQGTVLADGTYMMDMIDRYTNALILLPDDVFGLSIEGLLAVVKLVGHGFVNTLPGLQVMHPQGASLQRINNSSQSDIEYYTLGSNFTPDDPAWIKRLCLQAGDSLMDKIFQSENDLVVPTLGTYQGGHNSAAFPIPPERRHVYGKEDRIHHCNFFAQVDVRARIFAWLMDLGVRNV